MCTALGPQANSGSPRIKTTWFLVVICRALGPTSNQTRWANKQTSSKQDGQTSRKEKEKKKKKEKKEEKKKEKEKDKENEKEKEKEMEVCFICPAAVCPEGAGG